MQNREVDPGNQNKIVEELQGRVDLGRGVA